MRLSHVVVFILLARTCVVFSQETGQQPTALREGSWALLFQVAGNFTLTSFQGATISGKHHFSPRDALRLGLTLSGNTSSMDGTTGDFNADTVTVTGAGTSDRSSLSVTLSSEYVVYGDPPGVVHPFFGVGPLISYRYGRDASENSNARPGIPSARFTSTTTQESWGVGVSGVAGVEWFVTQAISLLAEYNLSVQYVRSELTSHREDIPGEGPSFKSTRENRTTGWSLAPNNVRLGLTVYL